MHTFQLHINCKIHCNHQSKGFEVNMIGEGGRENSEKVKKYMKLTWLSLLNVLLLLLLLQFCFVLFCLIIDFTWIILTGSFPVLRLLLFFKSLLHCSRWNKHGDFPTSKVLSAVMTLRVTNKSLIYKGFGIYFWVLYYVGKVTLDIAHSGGKRFP